MVNLFYQNMKFKQLDTTHKGTQGFAYDRNDSKLYAYNGDMICVGLQVLDYYSCE